MRTSSRYLALLVAILSSGLFISAQAQRKPDATTILNSMFEVYSRLASYQDEGILITTNDEPTGGTIEKMPFKTFFKRPNLFRFEWTDYGITKLGRTNIVWFNGKEAFTYWEPDRYEKEESLVLAVDGASGATSGTASTVSDLLLGNKTGVATLTQLVKVSLLGEEVFEGVRCYHIQAFAGDDPVELWVGKTDLLLRKLRRETKLDSRMWIREEIRRKIEVVQPIPEVVFNYKPPIPLTPAKDSDTEAMKKLIDPGPPVWSEFRSDEGQFSVLMPEKPNSQTSAMETPQGRFEQHVFIALHFPLLCVIAYVDLPKKLLVANDVDGFFDGLRDQFIKEVGGKLASENPVSLDAHPGREIKAHVYRGELRMRIYLVGDRAYILSITNLGNTSADEAFNKFFASFKLNPSPKTIARAGTSILRDENENETSRSTNPTRGLPEANRSSETATVAERQSTGR